MSTRLHGITSPKDHKIYSHRCNSLKICTCFLHFEIFYLLPFRPPDYYFKFLYDSGSFTMLMPRGFLLVIRYSCTSLLVGRSRNRFPMVSLGIFSVPTDGTMCPGLDSASKMSTRDFSCGKGGRCLRPTTYHPRSAERQENPGP